MESNTSFCVVISFIDVLSNPVLQTMQYSLLVPDKNDGCRNVLTNITVPSISRVRHSSGVILLFTGWKISGIMSLIL
jgi:hypothetical protein